jgi:hypothetical protein
MALTIDTNIDHKDVRVRRDQAVAELKDKIDNWSLLQPADKDEAAKLVAYITFLLVRETTGYGKEEPPNT